MTKQINRFDVRLSNLSMLAGVKRFKQFLGPNRAIVIGASGNMGEGIANAVTRAGVGILRQDLNQEALEKSRGNVVRTQAKAVQIHRLSEVQQRNINRGGLICKPVEYGEREPFAEISAAHTESRESGQRVVSDFLDAVLGAESRLRKEYGDVVLVIEAGPENLRFKQDVFEFLDLALKDDVVLASNTSSQKTSEMAKKTDHPQNLVGFHFFYPADRNPLLEIIVNEQTPLDIVEGMRQLALAMGKQPIVCWKDSPGAVANRILVGVLNEAAKIVEEGIAPADFVDRVFLETFYEKQIGIKLKKAQAQFNDAPKLSFFRDETNLYRRIEAIDAEVKKVLGKGRKGASKAEKLLDEKNVLLETAQGKLRQKVLYASIVENLERLGTFFKPAQMVKEAKDKANQQLSFVTRYLEQVKLNRENLVTEFKITSYKLDEPQLSDSTPFHKQHIKDRLQAAYIAIAQEILNEGLADIRDIEIACKQGFKWNIGPFELIENLGPRAEALVRENTEAASGDDTGICKPTAIEVITSDELSGVKTYIQDGIGYIDLGRSHIQNLAQTQNSLSPEMLEAISIGLTELQVKHAKAIVFKSQGGGVFCSGADLDYVQRTGWDFGKLKSFVDLGKKVMEEIRLCPLPTIALIDGPAVGGGAELACACDYRIMTDGLSYISFPEVGLGLDPEWRGTEYFPEIVGERLALAMICSTKNPLKALKLTGKDALSVGFANACVPQNELYTFLAEAIAGNIPEIDLSKKPERNQNFDKNDYPPDVVKKFGLKGEFKHRWRLLTRQAARHAERFIRNARDPEYAVRERTDVFAMGLAKSARRVNAIWIQPFVKAAQSKWFAPILEKLGMM